MCRTQLAAVAAALPVLLLPALALLPATAQAQQAPRANDWPNCGRDAGGQRFSPLTQITPGAQATPLVVNGVMYVPAGQNVFALEPETGRGSM